MTWSLVISPSIVPPPPPRLRPSHSIVSAAAIIVPGGRGRRSETTPYETRGAAALRPAAGGPVHPCPHAGPLVHGLVVVRRGRLPARLLGAAVLPHGRHRGGRRHPLPAALPERAAAAAPDGPPARRHRPGAGDPLFGKDVGFFMSPLPVYQWAASFLFSWLVIALIVVLVGSYLDLAPLLIRGLWSIPLRVRAHVSLLIGLLLLVRGWGFWLDTYGLVYSPTGVVTGAGYTDVYVVLPALRGMAVLFGLAALLLLVTRRLP